MNQYLRQHNARQTPQGQKMRADQVENRAGGFAWEVDIWTRARRFLILGAEGGTYYVGQRKLVAEAAEALAACLAEDGQRTINLIVEVSDRGLAPSNNEALFALAMATAAPDIDTRRAAWRALPMVARIGTHLLNFAEYREAVGGWGRATRRGVSAWYETREAKSLAYQMVKYRQRDGWTHRDILRLAHPSVPSPAHRLLYDFACNREIPADLPDDLAMVEGFRKAQAATTAREAAKLITEYGLPREAIQSEHLREAVVWQALLDAGMPTNALIRNLGNMTRAGVIAPLSANAETVAGRITDADALRKARVHPIALLSALRVYGSGGTAGRSQAEPFVPAEQIVEALDSAFYMAFESIEPANKRTLLALDVSGSMGWASAVAGLTCRDAAAAMAMATVRTEPTHHTCAFTGSLTPLPLTASQRLDDVIARTSGLPFGSTDCALPMIYADSAGLEVDTFVVYTDNETWFGRTHPVQALTAYREKSGINAKLVVVAMTADRFSIADPNDAGMLDVVGFDAAAPAMISAFSRGEV